MLSVRESNSRCLADKLSGYWLCFYADPYKTHDKNHHRYKSLKSRNIFLNESR